MCLKYKKNIPFGLKQVGEKMPRKKPEREVERVLFTFAEAQEFLRVSHQTLYKLMKEGLPSHKIGNKRMFLKDDLMKWIKEH